MPSSLNVTRGDIRIAVEIMREAANWLMDGTRPEYRRIDGTGSCPWQLSYVSPVFSGMKQVTMHEAKTHLSRLVEMALAGEEVVIARRDRPLVRLAVISEEATERRIGGLPDLIKSMGEDFNAPIEDWSESPVPESRRPPKSRKRRGR